MTAKRPMRRPIINATDLSHACRQQLLDGYSFFDEGYGDGDRTADMLERMKTDWVLYRDQILADWVTKHPGTRPWAWWQFDATARREPVDGSQHPFDRSERKRYAAKWQRLYPKRDLRLFELLYGMPAISLGERCTFETEAQYLTRLNLLLPGEAESLKYQ